MSKSNDVAEALKIKAKMKHKCWDIGGAVCVPGDERLSNHRQCSLRSVRYALTEEYEISLELDLAHSINK